MKHRLRTQFSHESDYCTVMKNRLLVVQGLSRESSWQRRFK